MMRQRNSSAKGFSQTVCLLFVCIKQKALPCMHVVCIECRLNEVVLFCLYAL